MECRGALTVLKENTATTLSHGESTLGSQPMTLDKAFAIRSERRWDSVTECVLPVRPQVKGLRLFAIGWRPWISLLMKSPTVMESGGSVRSSVSTCALVCQAARPPSQPASSFTHQTGASGPMAADRRPLCGGGCSLDFGVSGCRVKLGKPGRGLRIRGLGSGTACCKRSQSKKHRSLRGRQKIVGQRRKLGKCFAFRRERHRVGDQPAPVPTLARHCRGLRPCPIRVAGGVPRLCCACFSPLPQSCLCL